MNFLNDIRLAAAIWPEKIAIARGSGRVLAYQQVVAGAQAAAERLTRAGVRPGAIVSVEVVDPIHRILLTLALLMNGVCLINAGSSDGERSPAMSVALTSKPASGPPVAGLRTLLVDDQWFLGAAAGAPSKAGFAPGAPAIVWFTSGTTGRPKPLALSWARLGEKIAIRKSILGATNFDRVLIVPALSASFGMMTTLASLALGKSVFLVDYETDVFKVVSLFRIEYLVASTYQLSKVAEGAKSLAHDLSSLRGALFGGGSAGPGLIADALAYVTPNLLNTYASTEAGEAALGRAGLDAAAHGMVGTLAPWADVEIVSEEGAVLERGAAGRVRLRTPCIAKPFEDPTADYDAPDDWVYPGDTGLIDAKGRLVISGRSSEIINVGGVKMAPEIIEDVVLMIPGVEDVAAISVARAQDATEILHVFIAARPSAWDGIIRGCAAALPKTVAAQVHRVDKLPRTQLGKLERTALHEMPKLGGEAFPR